MIRVVALDIDGVVTDGTEAVLPADGPRAKHVAYVDLDAIHEARKDGFEFALLTAEDDAMVRTIAARLGIETVLAGVRDKSEGLREIARLHGCRPAEIAFVGDSNRDALAFDACGVSFAPANATTLARSQATFVLHCPGGHGAIAEAIEILFKLRRMQR